jgi:glycosyltransferase involved in cell wall biosynthesis
LKILQIIYESFGSPFGFGGAGMRAYEIFRRLKDRHDVTFLCMKYPGAEDGEIEGMKHCFVGTESNNLTGSVLAYTLKAMQFVRKNGGHFDIIIENFLPTTPFFSKFFTKTPVILQIQGIMEKHSLKKYNPIYSIPMYLFDRFYPLLYSRFIFVSEITKEKVMTARKRKAKLCLVIPNGIDRELLQSQPEDADYILFFSRIDIYTKGLDLLIDAFETISPEYPNLRLMLAGYEFNSFRKLISGSPSFLKGKIDYAGFVTGYEKLKLLSRARIFILPSRHESSPISILEAAACGKPLIVSDIPELAFVCREGFGISFPSGSSNGLSEKMRLLLADGKKREALGKRAREFAARFLWDDIAVQFEEVLKNIADNSEKTGGCKK